MAGRDLQKVVISDGIVAIAESTFSGCYNLKDIQIADSVMAIERDAFNYCKALETVKLPNSLTTISFQLFESCSSLKSVDIPDGVTAIELYAFRDSGIESIFISKSVQSIDETAFYGCKNLAAINVDEANPRYFSDNGVLYSKSSNGELYKLLLYPMAKTDEEYNVPDVLVDYYTEFTSNPYIKTLKFTSGDTLYGSGRTFSMISNLSSLKNVYLPIDTGRISEGIFSNCYAITDVYYDGCEEHWNKNVTFDGDNGSLPSATVHFNENDHYINGIELEVDEHKTIARFESKNETYYYNTYYQSKPF